jgi:DNA-binding Lrp family transcriptional regulator
MLINTVLGKGDQSYLERSKNIHNLINNLDGINSCHLVIGAYQIIAEVEVEDLSQIGKIVIDSIKAIPGVERCTVCLVIGETREEQSEELSMSGNLQTCQVNALALQ